MRLDNRSIFLVDGLGALVSAICLGLVLPRFERWVGMPTRALYPLGLIALVFAAYSLGCYRFADHTKPVWLRLIAGANSAYCLLTLGLVIAFFAQLTTLGLAYFVAESLIIVGLVCWEVKILHRLM